LTVSPGLLRHLLHARLHGGDQVEAAQCDRAQPDDLHAQPVALAGPGEESGPLQRGGQPRGGGLVHVERAGDLGDAKLDAGVVKGL